MQLIQQTLKQLLVFLGKNLVLWFGPQTGSEPGKHIFIQSQMDQTTEDGKRSQQGSGPNSFLERLQDYSAFVVLIS